MPTVPAAPMPRSWCAPQRPGSVTIEFDAGRRLSVSAPYWRFENLTIRGVCGATTIANTPSTWSARPTISRPQQHHQRLQRPLQDQRRGGRFPGPRPDRREHPGQYSARAHRQSGHADRPGGGQRLDHPAQPDHRLRQGRGDRISYGAFAKGGGAPMSSSATWCGASGACSGQPGSGSACRSAAAAPVRSIAATALHHRAGGKHPARQPDCSLLGRRHLSQQRSRSTLVADNTLLDTGGIDVRFPTSSARLDGNLVDGRSAAATAACCTWATIAARHRGLSFSATTSTRAMFAARSRAIFRGKWQGAA
jgi:hypothetical protein